MSMHTLAAIVASHGQMAASVIDLGSSYELQVIDLSTRKLRSMPALPPGLISEDSRLMWRPGTREVAFTFQNPRTRSSTAPRSIVSLPK